MIKNVAIYCRVSTEEQKKFGISVNDQKNSLTRYCKENNYKIYDYYIDEGVSAGTISKRKEFVRLLKELDYIDLILFTKLDRFSRNVKDANDILVILDEHNTAFRAIDEDDIDVSTADGRFIFNLKVNLAEHERNKDSERINRVNKYKYEVAKTVCSGKVPYGYKISENKKMVIDEEQAHQIRELFKHYSECNNLNKTTRWFGQTYNQKRASETIRKYLRNTAYIGEYKTKSGILVNDFCDAIVNEELFYRVQKLLDKNIKNYRPNPNAKRHNTSPYIFTGLLICPICGNRLNGKCNTHQKHYYSCKRHEYGKCVNKKCVTETAIEEYFLNNILKEIEKMEYEITKIENEENTENNINKSDSIKRKMDKLTDLYINDMVNKDYYEKEYNELKKLYESTKKIHKVKKNNKEHLKKVKQILNTNFFEIYKTLNNLEKRALWSSIIDYAIITDKNNIKIVVY